MNDPRSAREREDAVNARSIWMPLAAKLLAYRGTISAMMPRPGIAVALAKKNMANIRIEDPCLPGFAV